MQHEYLLLSNNFGQEYIGDVPYHGGPGSPKIGTRDESQQQQLEIPTSYGNYNNQLYEAPGDPTLPSHLMTTAYIPLIVTGHDGEYSCEWQQYAENQDTPHKNKDINYRFPNGYPEQTSDRIVNAPPPDPGLDKTDKYHPKSGSDTTDEPQNPKAHYTRANTVRAGAHRATKHDLRSPGTYCSLPGYMKQKNSYSLFSCYPDCKGERYGPDGFDRWWNLKVHLENCHGQNIPKKWAS